MRLTRLLPQVYVLQGASVAFGLLTLPLAARLLGAEGFGLYAYGMAVAALLAPVVELGLDLWLARQAVAGGSRLCAAYSAAVLLRAVVLAAALAGLCALAAVVEPWHQHATVAALFVLTLLPQALGVTALVQARGYWRADAAWTLAARIVFAAALVAVLPRQPNAVLAAALAAGSGAVYWVPMCRRLWRDTGIRFVRPQWADVRAVLATGWPLTAARAVTFSYVHSPVLLLGLLHSAAVAGVYAFAERFLRAAQQLVAPAAQLALTARWHAPEATARTLGGVQLLLGVAASLLLALAAHIALPALVPQFGAEAAAILLVLAPVAALASASNWWGMNGLGAGGHYRAYFLSVAAAAGCYWLLGPALAWRQGAIGMAVGVLLTELVATVAAVVLARRVCRATT